MVFQFKWLSVCKPRNFVCAIPSIYLSLIYHQCGTLIIVNFIIFVLSRFRASLLAANHLLIRGKTMFDNMQKSSRFLLEIIMLVSSANIMGIAKVFIVGDRSFIYVMKSKGPKIDPCGTPCFIVPQLK
jgi:hypothetical protein